MRNVGMWGPAAALAVMACAHGGAPAQVSDADFGRLQQGQTQPIDQARQEQAMAREELARGKLRLQQAEHETALAKADVTAADSDAKRAGAVATAANSNREPRQLEEANRLKDSAQLHKQEADAHVAYASKLVDARKAELSALQKRLDLADAQLDQAKLEALQQADIPASTKYDAGKFQTRVANARKDFDEAQQKAQKMGAEASSAQQAFLSAQRQFQARAGASGTPPATGTGGALDSGAATGTGSANPGSYTPPSSTYAPPGSTYAPPAPQAAPATPPAQEPAPGTYQPAPGSDAPPNPGTYDRGRGTFRQAPLGSGGR